MKLVHETIEQWSCQKRLICKTRAGVVALQELAPWHGASIAFLGTRRADAETGVRLPEAQNAAL